MIILQIVKTSEGAVWAFDQALGLKEKGYTIITVCPSSMGRSVQMYIDKGLRVIVADVSLPITRPWKIVARINQIKRIVNEVKPDIIHLHFVTNAIMLRLALKKVDTPRVFQVPGPLHLESKLARLLEIKTSNENDYWIGACKKTCELYRLYGIKDNHIFLGYYGGYGGAECDKYENGANILHHEYNILSSTKIVAMVSYFYKPKKYIGQSRGIKGHEDFIDAMSIVCKQNPNVIGMVIGGAWEKSDRYEKSVRKYAEKVIPGKIIFTGTRRDLFKIYREIDVAVHPSHSENLGGAAESLAAGVPTVSTNVGGFPDIVIDNETGYTVPPENPAELSKAIMKMLDDDTNARKLAKNGQNLVWMLLDINTSVQQMDSIYKEIIRRKKVVS